MAEQCSGLDRIVATKKRTRNMTATFKIRARMAHQNLQAVAALHQPEQAAHLKQQMKQNGVLKRFQKQTLKLSRACSQYLSARNTLKRNKQYMSTEWNVLPFAFPEIDDSLPKSKTINEILTLSLKQQKKDGVFDSKSSGFITIVVSRCLNAMKIDHKLDCGVRCINDTNTPHMWLVIDGYIIDNTYIPDVKPKSLEYLCKNTPTCYKSCESVQFSFLSTSGDFPELKSQTATDTFQLDKNLIKKLVDFYTKEPDKALALSLNKEESFDYYFSMKRHMYEKFHVYISGIDPKIRCVCWGCGCYPKSSQTFLSDIVSPVDFKETDTPSKTTWKFPHCSRCMVANYCSAECQNADWLDNHRFNCVPRSSACASRVTISFNV